MRLRNQLVAILLPLAGCQGQLQDFGVVPKSTQPAQVAPQPASQQTSQHAASQDPVTQLKSLVRPDAAEVEWRFEWGKRDKTERFEATRKLAPGGISFDVRKTDSLVTPFQGEIRIYVKRFNRSLTTGQIEEDVDDRLLVRFLYQDGKWVRDPNRYWVTAAGEVRKQTSFLQSWDKTVSKFLFLAEDGSQANEK